MVGFRAQTILHSIFVFGISRLEGTGKVYLVPWFLLPRHTNRRTSQSVFRGNWLRVMLSIMQRTTGIEIDCSCFLLNQNNVFTQLIVNYLVTIII